MRRWAVWISRWTATLIVAGGAMGLEGARQQSAGAILPERAAVDRYCVGCHNSNLKTAGLALDTIGAESVDRHPEAWEKVVRKLRARYMPPPGVPRPDERTYDALVSSLETSLDPAAAANPNPG